ncbi:chloride channel activity [Sparganum proliferum]
MTPLVELFLKASSADAGDRGSCPLSHKWFMVFYLLVERHAVNLRIIPVCTANPQREYSELFSGRRLPAVAIYEEHDEGKKTTGPSAVYAGNDELEDLMRQKFSGHINVDTEIQWVSCNLLRNLNSLLLTGQTRALLSDLHELDKFISKTHTTYLESDSVAYADCVIATKVQQVRVAGHFYGNFCIPPDLRCLWAYMSHIYAVPAFQISCPSDRDILLHYFDKMTFPQAADRTAVQRRILALEETQRSLSAPPALPNSLGGTSSSSSAVVRVDQTAMMTKVFNEATVQELLKKQVTFGPLP